MFASLLFGFAPSSNHLVREQAGGGLGAGLGATVGALVVAVVGVAAVAVAVPVPRRRAGAPRGCAAVALPRLPAVRGFLPPCLRRGAEELAQLLLHQRGTQYLDFFRSVGKAPTASPLHRA